MGIEDRDWAREAAAERRRGGGGFWVVGLVVAVALFALASGPGQRALGLRGGTAAAPPSDGTGDSTGDGTASTPAATDGVVIHSEAPPGRGSSLYPAHDAWQRYLADEATCPDAERTDLPPAQQLQIMVCLIDWAREQGGLTALPATPLLGSTAQAKADKIIRCREFAHGACGDEPDADIRATGYHGGFGENLYIASGAQGSPRVALDGWLNSPGHRDNLFRPEWRLQGIALVKLPHFGPYDDMSLWVSQFDTG